MMMNQLTKIAVVAFCSAFLAGTASAQLIAGWDFSQYRVAGSLDSGAGAADTLSANYSSLDPNGAGAGAAAAGTLFMNGANGSQAVTLATPEVVAAANDTRANKDGPLSFDGGSLSSVTLPVTTFDAFRLLDAEGQVFQSRTALTAPAARRVVFQADQGAANAGLWVLSLAGVTVSDTSDVGVEFADDCSSYGAVTTFTLTETEEVYRAVVSPGVIADDEVCVLLDLDPTSGTGGQPIIDNVTLPEPGAASAMAAGALLLAGLYRRRRV